MTERISADSEPFYGNYREFWVADFPEGLSDDARKHLEEQFDFKFYGYNDPDEYVVGFCFVDEPEPLERGRFDHLKFIVTRRLDDNWQPLHGVRIALHRLEGERDEFIDYDISEKSETLEPIFNALAQVKAGQQ